jgi:hypothetical protein
MARTRFTLVGIAGEDDIDVPNLKAPMPPAAKPAYWVVRERYATRSRPHPTKRDLCSSIVHGGGKRRSGIPNITEHRADWSHPRLLTGQAAERTRRR